jgi:(1->4)-alpha-D-glucan 1-alpha-D-glucosylmutase
MSNLLRIPDATYRLQFNKNFRFRDANMLVSYLNRLGISDIYASPILKARKGSLHGYDVTEPTTLNPELGTEKEFNRLANALRKQGMGLLLDIVPNHMAASPENPWWQDVVKKGQNSRFASFFDINWLDFEETGAKSTGHRRFFDIGDLVGVRVEDSEVFEATHSLIFRLIAEGKVTGLRIDHIDGLYDPLQYLLRLQENITQNNNKKPGFYVLVEKILSGDEAIPNCWPVHGTTGYDFIRTLNTFFINNEGLNHLESIYNQVTGSSQSFRELVYEKKRKVMLELFPNEVKALGDYLAFLSEELSNDEATLALVELTACLPVYRTYTRELSVNATDHQYIETAAEESAGRKIHLALALKYLKRVLLLDFPADFTAEKKNEWFQFVMHWQQLTGAIMAKGSEDTALYNYHRLVSIAEVGGEPDTGGLSISGFHRWNLARTECWPHTMNTTSTHDTKRSEDVRARINVLSEIPDEWERHLQSWMQFNQVKKRKADGQFFPEPNTEILLYQTLIGAWPLFLEEIMEFKERLKNYMIKAAREAKAFTSWLSINQQYEDALLGFIDSILDDSPNNGFLHDFTELQHKIAYCGALNSLSELLLKITSPGIPDFYQGTELWDFSLVDPDNRRPVDFKRRTKLLKSITNVENENMSSLIKEMLCFWQDGRIKLYVTYKALNTRRSYSALFQNGDYLPLKVTGRKRDYICAFIRSYQEDHILVAVPRFFTKLSESGIMPIGEQVWRDNRILLPKSASKNWLNALTGDTLQARFDFLSIGRVFDSLPIALLISCNDKYYH